jgi:hypothetical protein
MYNKNKAVTLTKLFAYNGIKRILEASLADLSKTSIGRGRSVLYQDAQR